MIFASQDDSVFKVPKLVSGLRAPGLAGAKRVGTNGLARPSSGYYSLSVKAAPEAETPEVGQDNWLFFLKEI